MRKLSAHHVKAAQLLWEGKSCPEVAEALGVKTGTVRQWAMEPLIKGEMDRLQTEQNERTKSQLDSAAKFQERVRRNTRELYDLCHGKIRAAIEMLEPDESPARALSPLVKAAKDITELALSTDEATLGLEQLAKELDAISKD